ncbi:cytochrome P460 family protein [Tenacibaculum maritimum]|uniref:cytochrome P460 family protein n=1 Tax=Tenacibaculum maritimum TaxID=107401 RepID=UPI000407E34D|nr:cytochrome P460 family protein [Tenacibaculum maritimum]
MLQKHKLLTKFILALFAITFISCGDNSTQTASSDMKDKVFYSFNNENELIRPTDYRSWVFVGTPVTPNDLNGGKAPFPEMHNVYIDPVSYQHWKQTGEFRDKTIIVKELVSVGATSAVSGKGYFEGDFIGLEAELKDKKRFPNEPGNWTIYSFTNEETGILKAATKHLPAEKCVACHEVNAADDYIFTQYYPVLRAAKGIGANVNPENAAKRTASAHEGTKKVGIWDPTAPTPKVTIGIPLGEKELFAFLQSGKYKQLKNKEKGTHTSSGPHETVRTFMSDELANSLKAGNTEHPLGSYAVKEQYKEDGTPYGWSVMAKTGNKTDGGNGWFWYEVTDNKDISKKATLGNGVKGCVSCHAIGKDMVRAEFPFKS